LKYSLGVIEYPTKFNSNYINSVEPCFTETLSEIIEKSGRKDNIKGLFKQRLRYLEEKKHLAVLKTDWFENPKNHKGICFIRIIDGDLNIRISFKMLSFKGKPYAILIAAFTETKKSNSKTANHKCHVDSIKDILENIGEVLENGL